MISIDRYVKNYYNSPSYHLSTHSWPGVVPFLQNKLFLSAKKRQKAKTNLTTSAYIGETPESQFRCCGFGQIDLETNIYFLPCFYLMSKEAPWDSSYSLPEDVLTCVLTLIILGLFSKKLGRQLFCANLVLSTCWIYL